MKAEDTIKNNPQYKEIMFQAYQLFSEGKEFKLTQDNIDTIIEISFKAGMEEGNQKAYECGVYNGKAEGIAEGLNEAVEWIELQHKWQGKNGETGKPFLKGWIVPVSELKAFKKEKGI